MSVFDRAAPRAYQKLFKDKFTIEGVGACKSSKRKCCVDIGPGRSRLSELGTWQPGYRVMIR